LRNIIFAYNSKSLNINSNTFTHLQRGIEYYSRRIGTTNIKYNVFNFSDYGLITATDENPVLSTFPYKNAPSGVLVDVQTRCNEFYDCKYGWVGTGEHGPQGSISLSTGNKFYNTQNWNVLVGFQSDYHYTFGSSIENPYNYQIGNLAMDGINYNSLSYAALCFNSLSGNSNSCNGSLPAMASETDPLSKLSTIFPNPFCENLNFQFESYCECIQILDVSGRLEMEFHQTNLTNVSLNTSTLSQGTKLIRVVFTDGTIATYKAIKL